MFNFIKGKRDTDIKVFHKNKIINRGNLIELNQKIQDKLFHHETVTNLVSITLTFSDSDVKTFGNWLAFEAQEWNHSCFTNSVVIEWEFSVIFPNHEKKIPQPHSMRVRIGAGLRPNEYFQVLMSGAEEYEISEAMSNMVFKIDFVNTIISNELKQIVIQWFENLPDNTIEGLLIRLAKQHRGKVEVILNFSFLLILAFLLIILVTGIIDYFLLNVSIGTPKQSLKLNYFFLIGSFPILLIIWKVCDYYTKRIMQKTIYSFKMAPMIRLTNGDQNRLNGVNSTNKKLVSELVQKIGITLAVGTILFVIKQFFPGLIEAGFRVIQGK